jgi:hypothetical protein
LSDLSGNLIDHCRSSHNNLCLYLSLENGKLFIVCEGLVLSDVKLYYDKFGRKPDLTKIETKWEDYYLDEESLYN